MEFWYSNRAPSFDTKKSKSILHPFSVNGYDGDTLNVYQGCHHRCGYCYATYVWSPDFYDKVYVKNNAAEILENQLRSGKYNCIEPVMISSASDPYQPAEIKFNLTRKCVQILQKYGVPYYIFTKSMLILRDLDLHRRYNENCFICWSITTCNERIRRIVEPGTPPTSSIFKVIKRFNDSGIQCVINIDPIMPLITDSETDILEILDNCHDARVDYVFGATLRLRNDIWERIKIIINLLEKEKGNQVINKIIKEYEKLYHFKEPLSHNYNLTVDRQYSTRILEYLKRKVQDKGMSFDFPQLRSRNLMKKKKRNNNQSDNKQLLLSDFT